MHTLELLNEQAVSKLLGISPKSLQSMRWRGGGPQYVKLGRRILYDPADLDAWIQGNKRSHTSQPRPVEGSERR